jgi:hypothetical protein
VQGPFRGSLQSGEVELPFAVGVLERVCREMLGGELECRLAVVPPDDTRMHAFADHTSAFAVDVPFAGGIAS